MIGLYAPILIYRVAMCANLAALACDARLIEATRRFEKIFYSLMRSCLTNRARNNLFEIGHHIVYI